ncbi:MAG: hypothetical protein ACE5DY_06435 [Mariprofundaceae bacterium]
MNAKIDPLSLFESNRGSANGNEIGKQVPKSALLPNQAKGLMDRLMP